MRTLLQSPSFQFALNIEKGTWSLHSHHPEGPSIQDVWMRARYRMGLSALIQRGKRRFELMEKWLEPRVSVGRYQSAQQGEGERIRVEVGPDANGVIFVLEFVLLEEHPLFLWRVRLRNQGRHPIQVERIEMLRAGFFPRRCLLPSPGPIMLRYRSKPAGYGVVRPHPSPGELRFFSNGWQSWSYSGAYGPDDVYRATRLGVFAAPMWYASGKAPQRKPGTFLSDMFGVLGDREHRSGILAGFLSQKQHFGTLEASIADPLYPALTLWVDGDLARLDPGMEMSTDWAVIQFVDLDAPDPLAAYLEAVARQHDLQSSALRHPPSVGWCSWYHYFQEIDEAKIIANLESAQEHQTGIPLELIQIDDGFEAQIGDWLEFREGFRRGVAPLAREIRKAGFTPGLWLAPFIVHSRSKLARERKAWLLRNRWGLPVNAGYVWNNFNKALDLTHPEALAYACQVVRTAVHEWGYPYLKLDFLYAAALKGRYRDRTKTRAQVLRMGLEALREAAGPGVILLGCGAPLGTCIGLVDAMRIGADVAPDWLPKFMPPQFFFHGEPNMPSVRNAVQNILTRAPLHDRWWVNDPDCLLLRPDSNLTLDEVRMLATAIALSGGAMLLSDDLRHLPDDRLRIARQILPLIGKRPRVVDWFDAHNPTLVGLDLENVTGRWHLLAVFNWEDEEKDRTLPLSRFGLPPGEYEAREFWTGESMRVLEGLLHLKCIPAHGVRLLSLRPISSDQPRYLGSDLHVSQGLEVAQWSESRSNGVRFSLQRPGRASGKIDLYLPRAPHQILLDQREIPWRSLGKERYQVQVSFEQAAWIEILF